MLDRKTVLTLFEETAKILVYNLDFISDDKLDWKPAPDAKSALEIVNHLAEFLDAVGRRLDMSDAEFRAATNRDEAKHLLTRIAARYSAAVSAASAEVLNARFRDDMPLLNNWMVTASTLDTIHHAGQIAYLQTLLGDTEIHFDPAALPAWAVN